MSFDYKVTNWSAGTTATPATFGTVFVQYGPTASGPWTTVYTINSGNHTPSTSCATPSFTFTPPAGNFFVRFDCIYGAGDYWLYFDDINISQATPTCSGAAAATASISSASGCDGVSLGLAAAGMDVGTGLDSEWEYSSVSDFSSDVNPTGLVSASESVTAPASTRYYRLRTTCTPSATTVYSNIVSYAGVSCASVVVPFAGNTANACGTSAIITDHAGGATYSANADGYLVLENTPGSFITLTGTYYVEGSSYDRVEIYDGAGTGGTLIASYTPTYNGAGTITPVVGTDGQQLTIYFYSDGSAQRDGFEFTALYSGTCAVCAGTPAAGTAAIDDANGCQVAPVQLSATGLDAVNIDYQWQVSNDNFSADISDIGGATSAIYNATTPPGAGVTYYRLKSTCTDSGLDAFSSVVTYTSVACGAFDLPGTSGANNTLTCGTNTWFYDDAGGATNYQNSFDSYTVLDASGTAQISLSGNYGTEGCCDDIYIYYGVGTGGTQVPGSPFAGSGSIDITGNVGEALTVRLDSDGSVSDFGFAFEVIYSGVCASCTGAPANGTVSIPSAGGCSGNTMTLTSAGLDVGADISYQWQVSNDNFVADINPISGETGTTYDLTTVDGTNYYRLATTCSAGPTTSFSNIVSFVGFACTPVSTPTSGSNTVSCGTTSILTDDGGLGSPYSNGADGFTVFEVNGTTASIQFTGTYAFESCCDRLLIYSGVGTGGALLYSYGAAGSGTIAPFTFGVGDGSAITFRLDADGSVNAAGIEIVAVYSGDCATCPAGPSVTAATSVTADDATLNWLAAVSGADDGYEWEVRADDASLPGTGSEIATGTVGTGILTVDVPGTPFSENTTYRVFARAICTTGTDFSDWNGPVSFTTPCAAEVAPTVVQAFGTFTPTCWEESTSAIPTSPAAINTNNGTWFGTTGFGNTGSDPGVKANIYGTATYWLVSQPVDLGVTGGVYRANYQMRVTNYNGTTAQSSLGSHQIHLIVSPDGGATWDDDDIIQTHTGAITAATVSGAVDIPVTYTGVVRFALVAEEGGFSPDVDFHFDDFVVEVIPSCFEPEVTAAADVTDESATINWTAAPAPTPVFYNWEVRESGAAG
ncbi:CUB domain-containing protein, partial [Flavobacteriales bacterium]|nr:CUB domain-containing protein [Flavobacteriales bacterium]